MQTSARSKGLSWAAAALVSIGLAGCGSTTDPTGPTNGSLTAKIDGSSWSAATIAVTYASGILAIAGTDAGGRTVGFGLGPVSAPGTFPSGPTSPTNASLQIITGSTAQAWQAAQTLGSGTVTVTAISATHAAGTFQFVVVPVAGTGATGNKAITQGAFDVTF